jgi:lysophospholipase L1-like esterase
VWIGNNDVLAAALTGLLVPVPNVSPGVTPIAQFETNYDTMITVLKTAPRLQGAVLIGVVQVAAAPALFPASALFIPTFKLGLDQAVGRTIVIDPSCIGSTSLISLSIVSFLRTSPNPAIIACTPQGAPGGLGDIFVLDPTEQTTLSNIIASYNNKIQSVATANGWAYFDPNPLLQTLKTRGCIATVPNIGSPTDPFGPCVSLDGVHPSGLAHKEITNALVGVINSKYFTSLQTIPIP